MHADVPPTAIPAASPLPEILSTVKARVAYARWAGLFVEEVRYAPGSRVIPAQRHHLVTLHLDASLHLCQKRSGHVSRERHTHGDITITPAGTDDQRVWDNPCHAVHFWLADSRLAQVAQKTTGTDLPVSLLQNQFLTRDPLIEQLAKEFLNVLAHARTDGGTDAGSSFYAESLGNVLAAHLLRRFGAAGEPSPPRGLSAPVLQRLRDFVRGNLDGDLSLQRLSETAGISRFHLARQFKEAAGTTLHQFVLESRIAYAKELLATPGVTVAEVAYRAGFGSQSLLTRHFKQIVGVTPAAFARARRNR